MEIIFKESGRSARIEKHFHKPVRVELTKCSLSFCPTLLGLKCSELFRLPLEQIDSVRRVNERGIPSFEVNAQGRSKLCWFDCTLPDDWESAFKAAGVVVEHEPSHLAEQVGSGA